MSLPRAKDLRKRAKRAREEEKVHSKELEEFFAKYGSQLKEAADAGLTMTLIGEPIEKVKYALGKMGYIVTSNKSGTTEISWWMK